MKVSLGPEACPSIILGECTGPEGKRLIKIRAHRLACWLMKGNPQAQLGRGLVEDMLSQTCERRGCVRLGCLLWKTSGEKTLRPLGPGGCPQPKRLIMMVWHGLRHCGVVKHKDKLWNAHAM